MSRGQNRPTFFRGRERRMKQEIARCSPKTEQQCRMARFLHRFSIDSTRESRTCVLHFATGVRVRRLEPNLFFCLFVLGDYRLLDLHSAEARVWTATTKRTAKSAGSLADPRCQKPAHTRTHPVDPFFAKNPLLLRFCVLISSCFELERFDSRSSLSCKAKKAAA